MRYGDFFILIYLTAQLRQTSEALRSSPSSILTYVSMASSISLRHIYSSAECDRAESPGPIFSESKGMRAWSLSVGEPKGVIPSSTQRRTRGWLSLMPEEWRRNYRAVTSLFRWLRTMSYTSSLV